MAFFSGIMPRTYTSVGADVISDVTPDNTPAVNLYLIKVHLEIDLCPPPKYMPGTNYFMRQFMLFPSPSAPE